MAYLKKVGKVYHIRWREYEDGKPVIRKKSLVTKYKDVAIKMLAELHRLRDLGEIDFSDPNFDPRLALVKDDQPKVKNKVLTCRQAVDAFYSYKMGIWSAQTKKTYMDVLEYWLRTEYLENKFIKSITVQQVRTAIFRPGIKATTMHHYYRHMRAMWTYFVKDGLVKRDLVTPLLKEIPKKRDNTRPKMLTQQEFDLIVETFDKELVRKQSTYSYDDSLVQNWFVPLIAVYFFAGLRRSEAAYDARMSYSGLKGRNLIYENEKLAYIALPPTKGRTERIVPISAKLSVHLETYLQYRGKVGPDEYVFVYAGGLYAGQPVRAKKVYELYKHYLKLAEIPSSRTLHGMRHAAVTTWIESGFNTAEAKIMAGHSSISVTEGYTHLTGRLLKEKMDRL
jgi:integrase